jgi:hypothetical protein
MRSTMRFARISWLASLLLVVLLMGCDVAQPQSLQSSGTNPGINIQGETFGIDWSFPDQMCRAVLVADATVSGLGAAHWNTPDGTRPASLDAATARKQAYMIITPVQLSAMQIHLDYRSQPASTQEFATIGGSVGADHYSLGYPQVTSRQHYLFAFVDALEAVTQRQTEQWMLIVGAFPVDAQGIVTLQNATAEQGTAIPARTMPLAQILQQLTGCKR